MSATPLLFSHSVISNSLWPHELQHVSLPCPSPFPRGCSDSCILSQWCRPTISSSATPFSFCHSLLFLPLIFLSIRVFSKESVLHIRWPKYWSFRFSISPSTDYSVLISIRIDWLKLLAAEETLKSLLQHHSEKASVLRHSSFFMVQLLHSYMTTGKTIALTKQTFDGNITSLLFNMLSGLDIVFLPRCKRLLISCLQSPFGPQ